MDTDLQEIAILSPVTIVYANTLYVSGFSTACYDSDNKLIKIGSELYGSRRAVTMVHEIGHAVCDANSCECMVAETHELAEYHAMLYTLNWVRHHPEFTEAFVTDMVKARYCCSQVHIKAAERIKALPEYQELEQSGSEIRSTDR